MENKSLRNYTKIMLSDEGFIELPTQDYEDLKYAFNKFDTKKEGRLGIKELEECLKVIGYNLNSKAIGHIFKKFDSDNSNSIDFSEFVQALHSYLFFNPTKTKILDDFERYDKDGSGQIDIEEVLGVLSMYKTLNGKIVEMVEMVVRQMDKNGDGKVSISEFAENKQLLAILFN